MTNSYHTGERVDVLVLKDIERIIQSMERVKRCLQTHHAGFYERWRAGGFIVSSDIVSMYPCLEDFLDRQVDEAEGEDES